MSNAIETIPNRRADDNLPMWVLREETPQELIDQWWNKGRKNKYFKPPINDQEMATYKERREAWWKMWEDNL